MKNFIPSLLVSISTLGIATAQSRTPFEESRQQAADMLIREWCFRQLTSQSTQKDIEEAKQREAQVRERLFLEKANKFIQRWKRFATQYNEKNAFDVKAASEASKAFHELEDSGDWPNAKKPLQMRGFARTRTDQIRQTATNNRPCLPDCCMD